MMAAKLKMSVLDPKRESLHVHGSNSLYYLEVKMLTLRGARASSSPQMMGCTAWKPITSTVSNNSSLASFQKPSSELDNPMNLVIFLANISECYYNSHNTMEDAL
jgi:hypothetical protein